MKEEKYTITGMSCSACSAHIEKAVKKVPGIRTVAVNLLTNSMLVTYDETVADAAAIIAAVTGAGYGAALPGSAETPLPATNELQTLKHRLRVSIIFLIPLVYIAMHTMWARLFGLPVPAAVASCLDGSQNAVTFAFSQFILLLPIMYLNRNYYITGFTNLYHRAPNMDTLVGLGSMASALFGIVAVFRIGHGLGTGNLALVQTYSTNLYFESAGMIVTLITVGKYLETKAKGKTGAAIEKLMNLSPKQATVLRDGKETTIPLSRLQVGDELIIRPGERIGADGVISQGYTGIDESSLTGESMPVEKGPGNTVTAATLNKSGTIRVIAERVGENTTLSQIIRLVEHAGAAKAPIAKIADTIAGIFVPAVISIAIAASLLWYFLFGADPEFSFSIGISILVISCPCALGLATPVALMVGIGKGAENGILIKSGEALETARAIDTVVLDKTGTITEGHPEVTDVLPRHISAEQLVSLAVTMEAASEHPLAEAVLTYGKQHAIMPRPVTALQPLFGKGIKVTYQNRTYYAGNETLMQELHIPIAPIKDRLQELTAAGKTPLLFASESEFLGLIAVTDKEKPTSAAAIAAFKQLGLTVIMITGDTFRTARALQKRLAIPHVIAGVLPQDKENHIARLQSSGHKVAMIGDGINDAPALARADLGIAIGAGTDIAMESADAVLMKSDLQDAVTAIRLSRAVIKNIKENLFWAFIYNIIGIPLAAGVLYPLYGIKLNPMIGAAAMSMSSVCVVLNALRLRFFHADRMTVPHRTPPVSERPLPPETAAYAYTLHIQGMTCHHCVQHVRQALLRTEGIQSADVSLKPAAARITAARPFLTPELSAIIRTAGYTLTAMTDDRPTGETTVVTIQGMTCQHCVQRVKTALQSLDEVQSVTVDLAAHTATIIGSRAFTPDELAPVIKKAGYTLLHKK